MDDFNQTVKDNGLIIVSLQSATLGTSSTQLLSDIPFRAVEFHNPHLSKTLLWSFDNSIWFKLFPLGTKTVIENHSDLYVKGSNTTSEYQIRYAKIQ